MVAVSVRKIQGIDMTTKPSRLLTTCHGTDGVARIIFSMIETSDGYSILPIQHEILWTRIGKFFRVLVPSIVGARALMRPSFSNLVGKRRGGGPCR